MIIIPHFSESSNVKLRQEKLSCLNAGEFQDLIYRSTAILQFALLVRRLQYPIEFPDMNG